MRTLMLGAALLWYALALGFALVTPSGDAPCR